MSSAPPARGARREWSELPPHVLRELEALFGARVVAAETQPHGFSPGIAARLRLDDGRRAFVKAVGPEPNPHSPTLHRQELRVVAGLPEAAPVPRFLGGVDEGEGGWVALAFEDVDGRHPVEPWDSVELELVLAAAHDLVAALTPAPVDAPPIADGLAALASWHLVRDDPQSGLDAWCARHLDELVALEALVSSVEGETLLHLDIRADNLLLANGRVYFVDWPHAHVGPPWVDAIGFAPSAAMQGGPEPEDVLTRWPGGEAADEGAVTAVIACVAGFFIHRSLLPPPPGLPTLRAFQAAQGEVARRWLALRTGWM